MTILILGNLSVERLEMEMLLELFYWWGGEPPLPRAMRILSWICQGLGNPWTGRSHRKLVREQAPMVCFLMETRLDTEGFNNLYGDLPFQNKIIVKHPYASGGLAFLWKNDNRLEVINYTANHVLAKVTEEDGFTWFMTGFYGWPET